MPAALPRAPKDSHGMHSAAVFHCQRVSRAVGGVLITSASVAAAERLDQHISGILTTVCNHSFHSSCISNWTDSSCPVCRYGQEPSDASQCAVCGTSEDLWICVICGVVNCGR